MKTKNLENFDWLIFQTKTSKLQKKSKKIKSKVFEPYCILH